MGCNASSSRQEPTADLPPSDEHEARQCPEFGQGSRACCHPMSHSWRAWMLTSRLRASVRTKKVEQNDSVDWQDVAASLRSQMSTHRPWIQDGFKVAVCPMG